LFPLLTFKLPLIVLAIPSIVMGWFSISILTNGFLNNVFYMQNTINKFANILQVSHGAGSMMMHGFISLPFFLVVSGGGVAWLCYVKKPEARVFLNKALAPVCIVLTNKYWINENVPINKIRIIIQKCLHTEYEIDVLLEEYMEQQVTVDGIEEDAYDMSNIGEDYQDGFGAEGVCNYDGEIVDWDC
jgi:NADH:ubiquinone oxidoreductase subunit 5 (subunit L)/multisubunit Na+/H+ antiporter MnhA subunit